PDPRGHRQCAPKMLDLATQSADMFVRGDKAEIARAIATGKQTVASLQPCLKGNSTRRNKWLAHLVLLDSVSLEDLADSRLCRRLVGSVDVCVKFPVDDIHAHPLSCLIHARQMHRV